MAKTTVMILGLVFVLIGIWGFFTDSILGLFEVDTVHNLVHLVSGLVALYMASRGTIAAHTYAKIFGVVYGLVAILGLVMGEGMLLGVMHVNNADNYLHVVLAVILLFVGFSKPSTTPSSMGTPMGMGNSM